MICGESIGLPMGQDYLIANLVPKCSSKICTKNDIKYTAKCMAGNKSSLGINRPLFTQHTT